MAIDFQKTLKELERLKNKKRKANLKRINKLLTSVVISKRIVRSNKATVTIREKKVPNIFHDPSRFFKKEVEEFNDTVF